MKRLPTFDCPSCRAPLVSELFEPDGNGRAKKPNKFEDCLRRCEKCGVAFSNSSNADEKCVPIIYRNPTDNVPDEVRFDVTEVLSQAINEVNRRNKIQKFCSSNSEDAVTWTIFRYLATAKKLRQTLANLGVSMAAKAVAEPILLLWGVPVNAAAESEKALGSDLIDIIDHLERKPRSRSEPDVVLDFGDLGVVFIEVKFKSPNDKKNEAKGDWSTYLQNTIAFQNTDSVIRSRLYELARNWRIGWEFAGDRPFLLVNLGRPKVFRGKESKGLESFSVGIKQDESHSFRKLAWSELVSAIPDKPDWLRRYDADRGLSLSRHDLVSSICEELSVGECCSILSQTHDFLVQAAVRALENATHDDVRSWGTTMKRLRVELPNQHRPYLIPGSIRTHNLVEIVNQCATIERLVDVLNWMKQPGSEFANHVVVKCHATTSSDKAKKGSLGDHDLILRDCNGTDHFFEVSDVAGLKDGNRKEIKDLISLGVLSGTHRSAKPAKQWPQARLYFICSSEFASRICRRSEKSSKSRHYRYARTEITAATSLVEVCKTDVAQGPPQSP